MVVEKSDDPFNRNTIPLDRPAFHWYNRKLKIKQTVRYFSENYGISRFTVYRAVREAEKASFEYRNTLRKAGASVLDQLGRKYPFGVLLAGRPYHGDPMINHNISAYFTAQGVPVLVLDALPHLHQQDLKQVRIDTTIPNHTKIIEGALCAARHPGLELVNVVSFGCGHDGVLSDELARLLRNISGKEPLVLKLDETDVAGPLTIRIKSFIETVRIKRERDSAAYRVPRCRDLSDAFAVKFLRRDKRTKTVLTPNLSPAFSTIISAVMRREGFSVHQMPLADAEAIRLGKTYVHNDVCFPAQINIGEALKYIRSGKVDPDSIAVGFAKNCEDCRAGQYAALARKALDDAGYPQVPIITTGRDIKNMHPGARFSPFFKLRMAWGLILMDGLEMMKRSIRPYELVPGETERIFQRYLNDIAEIITVNHRKSLELLDRAVTAFNEIPVRDEKKLPKVAVVGEIFLNHHPVSNCYIENYLEENGIEVVIPPMLDFFRRVFIIEMNKARRKLLPYPLVNLIISGLTDVIVGGIKDKADVVLNNFKRSTHRAGIKELVKNIEGMIDVSYIVGEGWLIPAEIIQMIKEGVNSFIMVQPFGCLPNHITGRGMIKAIKKLYPHVQILSLDFDPDVSPANIENRLQMLIMTAKEMHKKGGKGYAKAS